MASSVAALVGFAAMEVDEREESLETVTNDAVAGETVEPQPGDGTDDGPTGGAPAARARRR